MSPDQPGGVVLAAIQGYLGVLAAASACDHFLKDVSHVNSWLNLIEFILLILFIVALGLAIRDRGFLSIFEWKAASAISWLVTLELSRRQIKVHGI